MIVCLQESTKYSKSVNVCIKNNGCYNQPMLQKIVHWMIVLAVVGYILGYGYQLIATGGIGESCCVSYTSTY